MPQSVSLARAREQSAKSVLARASKVPKVPSEGVRKINARAPLGPLEHAYGRTAQRFNEPSRSTH